jgi:hypothetical protein
MAATIAFSAENSTPLFATHLGMRVAKRSLTNRRGEVRVVFFISTIRSLS